MTFQPDDPSRTSDPLADDYGSVLPPAPGASAIPPAPPQRPTTPDPGADRFSAFDDEAPEPSPAPTPPTPPTAPPPPTPATPATSTRALPPPQPPAGAAPQARPATGSGPTGPVTGPRRPRSRAARVVLVVLGFVVVLPVVSVIVLGLIVGNHDSDERKDRTQRTLVATEVSAKPSPVAEIPAQVDTVRVEIQGPGRTADVRVYTPDGTQNLRNRVLPYALDVPVSTDDAYLSVSADDYGYRGSQPVRCTISVGDTVLSTSVGTQDVECKVTDETWRRTR